MEHIFLNGCIRLLSDKESLITNLEARLQTDFEKKLFEAAINNLLDAYNPLRFNNFAYATRELVRHILSRLAPDSEVLACDWYKNEMDRDDGITRGQRISYAIQGGLSDQYVAQTLRIDKAPIQRRIRDILKNLSKHTHIQPDTIDIAASVQDEYVSESLKAVQDLFSLIDDSWRSVSEALIDQIDKEVVDRVISDTIDEIDEVATHHNIEEVCVEEVDVVAIGSTEIQLSVGGTISAELQYGSNGDMRRGDGVAFGHGFPFSCKFRTPVSHPGDFPDGPEDFHVNNDDWYEQT